MTAVIEDGGASSAAVRSALDTKRLRQAMSRIPFFSFLEQSDPGFSGSLGVLQVSGVGYPAAEGGGRFAEIVISHTGRGSPPSLTAIFPHFFGCPRTPEILGDSSRFDRADDVVIAYKPRNGSRR